MTSAHEPARTGSPYRGADRRLGLPPSPAHVPVLPALVVLLVVSALAAALLHDDPVRSEAYRQVLRVLRASAFTAAGLLGLLRWRLTGLSRPAVVGTALLVLGVLGEPVRYLVPLVHGAGDRPLPDVLTTVGSGAAALCLLLWARRAPAIDAKARPGRWLALVVVVVPGVGITAIVGAAPVSLSEHAVALALPHLVLAAVWAWLAGSERRASTGDRGSWLVTVLACLAGASALRGAAVFAEPVGVAAGVVGLGAGVIALHGKFTTVLSSLSAQSSHLLRLTVDVHDHTESRRTAQAQEEERLHEVRNVLAGLHGATSTLRRYEDRLDPGVRRRLEDAVSGELRRLAHLVDPERASPLVEVDLDQVLGPVVVAELEQGADVHVDLCRLRVVGRPVDLATVVSALLVNARRHAPGSPVLLRADATDAEVRVRVEDRGPGVPLDLRQTVFERGERAGAHAPGSGLGLYTARRLTADMGGTLQVESRAGGGASFVLTLPQGSVADARQHPAEGGAQAGEVDDRAVGRLERRAIPRQRDHGAGAHLGRPATADDGHLSLVRPIRLGAGDALEVEGPADGVAEQPG